MENKTALEWIEGEHGQVCTQGGHVVRWRHDGSDVLFVARHARFEPGQAIRGGIPVIFPWFGDDPLNAGRGAHGFARRVPWRVVSSSSSAAGIAATLELRDDDRTRAQWPQRFVLRLRVKLAERLELELVTENHGDAPMKFEQALHSYFQVGDIRAIALRGLEGARYFDKLDRFTAKHAPREPLGFSGPVDSVFEGAAGPCEFEDIVHGRTVHIEKRGSRSTIVWNPWIEGSKRYPEFAAEDWAHMLCVESGNVGADAITLAPGASHSLGLTIRVS